MDMKVIHGDDEMTHVVLDGRFDIQGAQEVDSRFEELAKSSKALVVDLSKVSFLASLGIRTLMLSAKTLLRRGAEMAVCGASESVEKVLRTPGFNEVAGLYPDYDTAARALQERLAAFSGKKTLASFGLRSARATFPLQSRPPRRLRTGSPVRRATWDLVKRLNSPLVFASKRCFSTPSRMATPIAPRSRCALSPTASSSSSPTTARRSIRQ